MSDPIDRQAAKDFEKQLHDMFDHIWDCEIDHPAFQDTVGELMEAVIQAHKNSAQPEQDREFMKLTVRNSNGRPYYSIIYLEFDDNGIGHDFEGYSSYSLDVISDYLKKYFMPSAQPKRKPGKWIYGEDEYGIDGYHCDECGFFVPWDYAHKFINYIEDYNFCPHCGADMREDEDAVD